MSRFVGYPSTFVTPGVLVTLGSQHPRQECHLTRVWLNIIHPGNIWNTSGGRKLFHVFSRLVSYEQHHLQPRINYPHFAWPARILFQVGINWNILKRTGWSAIRHCDLYETYQEKGRGLQQLVKRENSCPGVLRWFNGWFPNHQTFRHSEVQFIQA